MKAGLDAPEAAIGNRNGDARAALAGAAKRVEAVYGYPHQNHACMEVMNATALWTPERCEVWTPTQNGEAALAATAFRTGLAGALRTLAVTATAATTSTAAISIATAGVSRRGRRP